MIAPTSAPTASSFTASGTTQATASLSSDFETFLKMLTAQARYQDPLEPLDSSEYAAQLAQFSMVEQQVMSNDLLTALAAQMGSNNVTQMSGWIGMEALSTAPAPFTGAPITITPNPAAVADEVFLIVRDESGAEVQRVPLPVSADPYAWDGTGPDGTTLPHGNYAFDIESRANGEVILTDPVATYARITEARMQPDGQTVLILEGGGAVLSSAVSGLREPQSAPVPASVPATGPAPQGTPFSGSGPLGGDPAPGAAGDTGGAGAGTAGPGGNPLRAEAAPAALSRAASFTGR